MKISILNIHGESGGYFLSELDRTDYDRIKCLNEELYDYKTGEPLNEEVKEMDKCIEKGWNPERFIELFNKLNKSDFHAHLI